MEEDVETAVRDGLLSESVELDAQLLVREFPADHRASRPDLVEDVLGNDFEVEQLFQPFSLERTKGIPVSLVLSQHIRTTEPLTISMPLVVMPPGPASLIASVSVHQPKPFCWPTQLLGRGL